MPANGVMPELKEIVGAMIFAANRPIGIKEMHRCLLEVAETRGGETKVFADTRPADVEAALEELEKDLSQARTGFALSEVAGGFRLQSAASCGKWLKHLLSRDKPRRLSVPALETLAIIAYRQPITRSEIENVRGVAVDHVVKLLMELHLIKIVGRSELPGRPFLYGTTRNFLEHFGLKDLKDLERLGPGILKSLEQERVRAEKAAAAEAAGGQEELGATAAETGKLDGENGSPDGSGDADLPVDTVPKENGADAGSGDAEADDDEEDEYDDEDDDEDED